MTLAAAVIMLWANFSSLSFSTPLVQIHIHTNLSPSNNQLQTVEAIAPPKKKFLFLAFYYPWYVAGDRAWSKYGQDLRPLLGHYGSDEMSVAERHIEMAVRGGIDCLVVSWWKRNSPAAMKFLNTTLKASNIDQVKFAMLYESKGALTGGGSDGDFAVGAIDVFVSDLIYFKEKYFDHPSYFHINERPVVYVYLTRFWKNFTRDMLQTINDRVGSNILIIADNPYYDANSSPHTSPNGIRDNSPVFEVYTSYNMYQYTRVQFGERAVDYMLRHALPVYQQWSRDTVFFPHVLPKYRDFREGHKPLVGDTKGFARQLREFACLPRPAWYRNEFPNLMFVTSFNEWWEGSSVEPDKDEYGYQYLDAIKSFKDSEWVCQENQNKSLIVQA